MLCVKEKYLSIDDKLSMSKRERRKKRRGVVLQTLYYNHKFLLWANILIQLHHKKLNDKHEFSRIVEAHKQFSINI